MTNLLIMKKIALIALILSAFTASSQNVTLSDNQLNINIVPITISYARKIDSNKSLTISGGISPTVYTESRLGETKSYVFINPYFTASFRNYYSRKKIKKNNLKNNSGNYIGLYFQELFKPFGSASNINDQFARNRTTNAFDVGPVWGIERNYASGIHLKLNLGIGYTNGKFQEGGDVSFIGGFELGYTLFSK